MVSKIFQLQICTHLISFYDTCGVWSFQPGFLPKHGLPQAPSWSAHSFPCPREDTSWCEVDGVIFRGRGWWCRIRLLGWSGSIHCLIPRSQKELHLAVPWMASWQPRQVLEENRCLKEVIHPPRSRKWGRKRVPFPVRGRLQLTAERECLNAIPWDFSFILFFFLHFLKFFSLKCKTAFKILAWHRKISLCLRALRLPRSQLNCRL